jgi:O-antigen/teichoic acid export membrane protein
MGTGFEDSYYPAQILVSFWLFNGITEVGSGLLTAKGYVKYKFVVSAINAAVNLTLSLILVQYIGLAGVALGTAIGMILVQAPLITRKFLKVTDISFWEYFNKAIKRSLLIYLCAAGLSYLILSFTDLQSLVLILVAMGIVYILSVILGFFISLSAGERHELVSLVKLL